MALHCPVGFDVDKLRRAVADEYTRVVEQPKADFHFHLGFDYAVNLLGYDADELTALPSEAVDRFAGVGNPLAIGPLSAGETVLDIGCGAGTDMLIAAMRVGPSGRAIGVDATAAMRAEAQRNATRANLSERVEIRAGMAEELPVEDESVDVVISNGVLNLAIDKHQAFAEIMRVLRPGGRLMIADVSLQRDLSEGARRDADLWAA
jgi:SAM-dependent methyltransferase